MVGDGGRCGGSGMQYAYMISELVQANREGVFGSLDFAMLERMSIATSV